MAWRSSPVRQLEIELSNNCNAACPMCPRYHHNSPIVSPGLRLGQIYYDQFVEWFPREFLADLHLLVPCGTHGDPMMARDVLPIVRYVVSCNPGVLLWIHTNGGVRGHDFWSELGSVSSTSNLSVIFSIDGLRDTNHLYRRNVAWERLMANIESYLGAGGKATWEYLIFKHNQHQIDEARTLSADMGFAAFRTKRAFGFDSGRGPRRMPVIGQDGRLLRWIDPPDDDSMRHRHGDGPLIEPNMEFDPADISVQLCDDGTSIPHGVDAISCKSIKAHGTEIYVDCFGMVHPCVYVGYTLNSHQGTARKMQLESAVRCSRDLLDLSKQGSITRIIENGTLDMIYAESWKRSSCADGMLIECAVTCSQGKPYVSYDMLYV